MAEEFRDLKTLLDEISSPMASANGSGYERGKAELTAKLSNDICTILGKLHSSVIAGTESSDKLGKKIFWLNIVLAFATTVGAIATVVIAFKG